MENIKNKIKAVIFDMDGTIIKTEHIWEEATNEILRRRGFISFTDKQSKFLKSLSGIGLEKSAEIIKKEFDISDPVHKLFTEAKKIAHTMFNDDIEFVDGFEEFHKKLQDSFIPTGIATNADEMSLRLINKKMNLSKFFGENIYGIAHVGNKPKPDPALFLHAAKQLNVKPYECVVFEDSTFGFEAANSAGMKCIAIKNNLNKKSLDKVHAAIESYHEAITALLKLHSSF